MHSSSNFRNGPALVRLILVIAALGALALPAKLVSADQSQDKKKEEEKKDTQPATSKEVEKIEERLAKLKGTTIKLSPAEIIVETAILAYGGRAALKTARTLSMEQGKIRLATDQGDVNGTYMLRRAWKDKSWDDLLRTDIDLQTPEDAQKQGAPPKVNYVLAFNGGSVWAAQDGHYITPSPESIAAFKSQLNHDYTSLLRYKEDGSKIELIGPETVVGIDTNVIELTTPDGEKTRFWLSSKTYRILHLQYELKLPDGSLRKFRVSYYPPMRVIANTLVPARRVTEESGKFVQEVDIEAFNYAAKIDPEIFQHLQE